MRAFCKNFAYAKFHEKKSHENGKVTLWLTDICRTCFCCEVLTSQVCLLMIYAGENVKIIKIYSISP